MVHTALVVGKGTERRNKDTKSTLVKSNKTRTMITMTFYDDDDNDNDDDDDEEEEEEEEDCFLDMFSMVTSFTSAFTRAWDLQALPLGSIKRHLGPSNFENAVKYNSVCCQRILRVELKRNMETLQ